VTAPACGPLAEAHPNNTYVQKKRRSNYNRVMPSPSRTLDQDLEGILNGYRKGLCDKMRTLEYVALLRRRVSDAESGQLCRMLADLFRTSETKKSEQVGGYIVNMMTLALSCLAEVCPTEKLPELVFSRFPVGVPEKIEIWASELVPELGWSLSRHADKFGAEALSRIKAQAALARASADIYPPSAVSALNQLEKTAEWVEFQRFAKTLTDGAAPVPVTGFSLEESPATSNMSPAVASALQEAGRRLNAQGEFDAKTAGDLIRSAMDEAHREIVRELESIHRKPYAGGDKDGARRGYMRSVDFITLPEEEFFSGIYSLISREAAHRLVAPRETVLLVHQTVSNYLLLLTERLNKLKARQEHSHG
jgi:hypothetical protein